jgi:hypothetical protein
VHWAVVLVQYAFKGFLTGTVPLATDALILGAYLVVFVLVAAVVLTVTQRLRPRAFTTPPPPRHALASAGRR